MSPTITSWSSNGMVCPSPPCLLTALLLTYSWNWKKEDHICQPNVSLYSSSSPMARLDCAKSIVIIKTEYSAYQHVQQAVMGMKVSVVVFRGKNRNAFRWLLADKELNPKRFECCTALYLYIKPAKQVLLINYNHWKYITKLWRYNY